MNQFWEAIDDCELIDLGFYRDSLTWKNGQDCPRNIQERLDCCLRVLSGKSSLADLESFTKTFLGQIIGPYKLSLISKLYVSHIIKLHGIPLSIQIVTAVSSPFFGKMFNER